MTSNQQRVTTCNTRVEYMGMTMATVTVNKNPKNNTSKLTF